MRVLVVGASGAIDAHLVPQLQARGHAVIATFRSSSKAERLRALGAEPIVLDALDAEATRQAVTSTRPDAIIYQATALAELSDLKHFDRSFAQTNRMPARLFASEAPVVMATESRGASNAKATRDLGWTLRFLSWRQGFIAAYGQPKGVTAEERSAEAGRG